MSESKTNELGNIQKVRIPELEFLYIEIPNDIESQSSAWPRFESAFPSLTGRKMYGLNYENKGIYRVCSLVLDIDKEERYGLEKFEFEGGQYVRLRLKYEPPILFEKIGPAYDLLISKYKEFINYDRPIIEQYKSRNVLDILIPINEM